MGFDLKTGIMVTFSEKILRSVLNSSLENTDDKQLVEAIRTNTSLWGNNSEYIMEQQSVLPDWLIRKIEDSGKAIREVIDLKYSNGQVSGFTKLVLSWLYEDHPSYYNIIMNEQWNGAGIFWLENQVNEILGGLGFDK
jgi:hypothetical protein